MNEILQQYEMFVDEVWFGCPPSERVLDDLFVATAGLGGETGEVLERLKKYVRDGTDDREGLKKELGDVLYYLTFLSHAFGFTLAEVISANMEKILSRRERNVLHGSGDNR